MYAFIWRCGCFLPARIIGEAVFFRVHGSRPRDCVVPCSVCDLEGQVRTVVFAATLSMTSTAASRMLLVVGSAQVRILFRAPSITSTMALPLS